jgi:hypothetical protein
MRKLLEIDFQEEVKRNMITVYILGVLIFSVFLLTRTIERSIFNLGFLLEFMFVFASIRFYVTALTNRNYAFWGMSIVIFMYLLMHILHYTFLNYNLLVLYLSILSGVFLAVNGYIMSSPLYFPRIQWWEYDFRYRGELKAEIKYLDGKLAARVADIRRECISFLAFESIRLGKEVIVEIPFGKKTFEIKGTLKTSREDIPGRPIRYGFKVDTEDKANDKSYNELKKVWGLKKQANIRRKFSDYIESKEASEV